MNACPLKTDVRILLFSAVVFYVQSRLTSRSFGLMSRARPCITWEDYLNGFQYSPDRRYIPPSPWHLWCHVRLNGCRVRLNQHSDSDAGAEHHQDTYGQLRAGSTEYYVYSHRI